MITKTPLHEGMSLRSHSIEIQDIFRAHAHKLGILKGHKGKVVHDIIQCRTKELGGHITTYACDACGYTDQSYNSCRNRHCPKCQGLAGVKWTQERMKDLLPVQYFHGVFTLPHIFNRIICANKQVSFNILFRAVSETLKETACNPHNLGADIGCICVLQTWTQHMLYHVHMHCVIPGGGIGPKGDQWIPCRKNFFVHVYKLSSVFRGKFLHHLGQAFNNGELNFPGDLKPYSRKWRFKQLLIRSCTSQWVVYAKKPFDGPDQVIRYLSRYIQRIALSNKRILKLENDRVYFTYTDRNDRYRRKTTSLEVTRFMKRYLLHIVPRRFVRVRYYGFLSNRNRAHTIALIREWLGTPEHAEPDTTTDKETWEELLFRVTGIDITLCPQCGKGHMIRTYMHYVPRSPYYYEQEIDTS